ncbi:MULTISPECIES: methionine gamma-lyase family protein [unclassified Sedimentibacter]|uniref:methionine gamma-lyase family protein n=1 Tax=unclassified Sedimentibacter TaxID=2649220 RepID=UPI0027E0D8C5|nr:methionine gamma-lyase family protein [Sedimentibacter sp. MB35-C1]WMJ76184.1 methionine gamma-lyase family protein [Sedimentibacter sp. MB35-C1]
MLTENILCKQFGVSKPVFDYVEKIEQVVKKQYFEKIEQTREYNQYKVISAMQEHKLDYTNFYWNTGYGYDDPGREKAEKIFASVFNTEDALVRPSIASGTHALYLTLSSLLGFGDEVIAISGRPYDTMLTVLGEEGNEPCNLKEAGVIYKEVPLYNNDIDWEGTLKEISLKTKLLMIQRSTGYSFRPALSLEKIKNAIEQIRNVYPDILIMVDNCYGEFIDKIEPSDIGADVVVGSLIKNPGGGIALSGGYVVGKKTVIDRIANRLTAPGVGREIGLTYGTTRNTLQGLFFAPHIVSEALKGAVLFGELFSSLGFEVTPSRDDSRSDIIQAIKFNNEDMVVKICEAIQAASPVDSHVSPVPWDMPGYTNKVIMASGAFVSGSSIELSADAPIRPPYIVYIQGGLFYDHAKLGAMICLQKLMEYEDIKEKITANL